MAESPKRRHGGQSRDLAARDHMAAAGIRIRPSGNHPSQLDGLRDFDGGSNIGTTDDLWTPTQHSVIGTEYQISSTTAAQAAWLRPGVPGLRRGDCCPFWGGSRCCG